MQSQSQLCLLLGKKKKKTWSVADTHTEKQIDEKYTVSRRLIDRRILLL